MNVNDCRFNEETSKMKLEFAQFVLFSSTTNAVNYYFYFFFLQTLHEQSDEREITKRVERTKANKKEK